MNTAELFDLHDDATVTPEDAARMLGVTPKTLAVWRCVKRYPITYLKIGRKVRYRVSDIKAFLTSRTVNPEASANAATPRIKNPANSETPRAINPIEQLVRTDPATRREEWKRSRGITE